LEFSAFVRFVRNPFLAALDIGVALLAVLVVDNVYGYAGAVVVIAAIHVACQRSSRGSQAQAPDR
jgi:hypothetical protein